MELKAFTVLFKFTPTSYRSIFVLFMAIYGK